MDRKIVSAKTKKKSKARVGATTRATARAGERRRVRAKAGREARCMTTRNMPSRIRAGAMLRMACK
jgi:hypothetical protein